jgi:hypothetical protein
MGNAPIDSKAAFLYDSLYAALKSRLTENTHP